MHFYYLGYDFLVMVLQTLHLMTTLVWLRW